MTDTNLSNSEMDIGNAEEQTDTVADTEKQTQSDDFFAALENDVNGMVQDETAGNPDKGTAKTPPQEQTINETDWKKRYSDSTREAQKMRERLNDLEPYSPLVNAMKKDSGLVSTVQNYLQNGGQVPQTVGDKFNLPEDYEFDVQNAFTDGESKDAKVLNAMMDQYVSTRVNAILGAEKQKSAAVQKAMVTRSQEAEFAKRKGLTNDQMGDFKKKASSHTLTFDDAWNIVNREKIDKNIANSTKADQMKQMKNVRQMPASTAGTNSQSKTITVDDSVFEHLLSSDGDVDNLFG